VQDLKPTDLPSRQRFSVWALEMFEEDLLLSTKIDSVMRLIFRLMATSISKIAEFRMKNNPKRFKSCNYIQKKRQFGVAYGLVELSVHISSKMKPGKT
jgi:hypothetical protein